MTAFYDAPMFRQLPGLPPKPEVPAVPVSNVGLHTPPTPLTRSLMDKLMQALGMDLAGDFTVTEQVGWEGPLVITAYNLNGLTQTKSHANWDRMMRETLTPKLQELRKRLDDSIDRLTRAVA